MRISSSPNSPLSPPCGLSAATAMRGRSMPVARSVASASSIAAAMRSGVIRLTASRSATCEVTRKVENSSITFISPKKPECRVSAANIWCSSAYFQPPRLSAALLSGAKQMPSRPPPSARPIMCSSVSPASRPDSGETSPRLMRAGSMLPRSTSGTRSCDQSIAATAGTVCHSSSTPASLQPSSSTRASPITTTRAPLLYLPAASSLALISGPMPVMSPSISPMTGRRPVMIAWLRKRLLQEQERKRAAHAA